MDRHALRVATGVVTAMALFCVGTAWLVYQTTEPRPLPPVFAGAEPVVIPTDKTPNLEWINPSANTGDQQVVSFVLGIWTMDDPNGVAADMKKVAGPGVSTTAGANSQYPLRPVFDELGPGKYILRLQCYSTKKTSQWSPSGGIEVDECIQLGHGLHLQ